MERSYVLELEKKNSAFVEEHLSKIILSIYFCLKCSTGKENQAENLYLLFLNFFSFDLVFGSDRIPYAHKRKQSNFYATLIFHN